MPNIHLNPKKRYRVSSERRYKHTEISKARFSPIQNLNLISLKQFSSHNQAYKIVGVSSVSSSTSIHYHTGPNTILVGFMNLMN